MTEAGSFRTFVRVNGQMTPEEIGRAIAGLQSHTNSLDARIVALETHVESLTTAVAALVGQLLEETP